MIVQNKNAIISAATIVEPTGVENKIDTIIPINAQLTDIIPDKITTPLKLHITRIADNAGNIINAEINNEPTKFIPNTIITAMITAIIK